MLVFCPASLKRFGIRVADACEKEGEGGPAEMVLDSSTLPPLVALPCPGTVSCALLTCLEESTEERPLLCALLNQRGKPCRRLKPPGGSLSSSVALTVSELADPVVYVYVVRGATKGWNMSDTKVTVGGRKG